MPEQISLLGSLEVVQSFPQVPRIIFHELSSVGEIRVCAESQLIQILENFLTWIHETYIVSQMLNADRNIIYHL